MKLKSEITKEKAENQLNRQIEDGNALVRNYNFEALSDEYSKWQNEYSLELSKIFEKPNIIGPLAAISSMHVIKAITETELEKTNAVHDKIREEIKYLKSILSNLQSGEDA